MKNYYEILEVNKKASKEIIETTYKILIEKYNPSRYIGEEKLYAQNRSSDIEEAYKVLSNNFLREQYDIELQKELDRQKNYRNNTNTVTNDYNRKNNITNSNKNKTVREMTKEEKREYRKKMSSLTGAIKLTKELYANRPKIEKKEKFTKKDAFAIGLTIIIVLLIGVVLWFIPFTNGFIRELLFENPLFNWIWK